MSRSLSSGWLLSRPTRWADPPPLLLPTVRPRGTIFCAARRRVGCPHRIPALAAARFLRGVLMTKLYFLLQCTTTLPALHNDPATAIFRRPERGGRNREGLDIMRKSLPIALVLGAFTIAGAAFALAPAIHSQVTRHPVAGAPSQSALLDGKSVRQDRHTPPPRLFHACQQQDPTTIPASHGTVCFPLPY